MNIVNAQKADTGGQGINLSRAIHQIYPGIHTSRMFTGKLNYCDTPYDILYQNKWKIEGFPAEVMDIWKSADVYHLHNSRGWMGQWPLRAMNPKAGVIIHIHGRPSSKNSKAMREGNEKAQGIIRVVSTPCLLNRVFSTNRTERWFPAPIDIVRIKKLRRGGRKNDGIIRVVHAPTVHKNTREFLEVMKLIEQKYSHVKTIVITKQTQAKAIKLKTVGTIHFNALGMGMGNNVFECMAMGIPSITGNWDPTYPDLIRELHPNHVLPYINVTEKKDLFDAIERLILDEPLRAELAAAGLVWVEKYHSFENTTALAIKTYQEAIDMRS